MWFDEYGENAEDFKTTSCGTAQYLLVFIRISVTMVSLSCIESELIS